MEKLKTLIKTLDNFYDLSTLLIYEIGYEIEELSNSIKVEILPREPTDDTN